MGDKDKPTARNTARQRVEKELERLREEGPPENADDVARYMRVREADEDCSEHTMANAARALVLLNRWLDGDTFGHEDCAVFRDDLRDFRSWLLHDAEKYGGGTGYAESTTGTHMMSVRRFYLWHHNRDRYEAGSGLRSALRKDPPTCVRWISDNGNGSKDLPVDELLSEDDVATLIDACTNPRDKALVITLYETGARLGEFASLDVRHVEIGDQVTTVRIPESKTETRVVDVFHAGPHLRDHLNSHPLDSHPDAPLWYSLDPGTMREARKALENGDPATAFDRARLARTSINNVLKRIANRTTLDKKVTPHRFRHARATKLAGSLSESELRQFFGWARSSDMPEVYVSLRGGEANERLRELHGIEEREDPRDSPLAGEGCRWCGAETPASASYCPACGRLIGQDAPAPGETRGVDVNPETVAKVIEALGYEPDDKGHNLSMKDLHLAVSLARRDVVPMPSTAVLNNPDLAEIWKAQLESETAASDTPGQRSE